MTVSLHIGSFVSGFICGFILILAVLFGLVAKEC